MRVMITGGGTGGHTSPAVAIIEELRRRDPHVILQWAGRRGAIEERVSAGQGVPFRGLAVEGWPRTWSLRRVWVLLKLAWGMVRAAWLVKRFRPDVVVGVGGYVSLPMAWAAQRMGVPTVLHEQNKRLGMANRILARHATRIFLSYEDTLGKYPKGKARVVGNPVRADFLDPPGIEDARRSMGLDEAAPVVLVAGGSQGAQSLNDAMAGVLRAFAAHEAQFLWMTGATGFEAARQAAVETTARVEVFPFIDDMARACAAADLLVSRAGASTTAEIAVLGKPSILVPYPHATDNHQEQNARALEEKGAAVVLLDDACTAQALAECIRGLLGDKARLETMGRAAAALAKPDAAPSIVDEITGIVAGATHARDTIQD